MCAVDVVVSRHSVNHHIFLFIHVYVLSKSCSSLFNCNIETIKL